MSARRSTAITILLACLLGAAMGAPAWAAKGDLVGPRQPAAAPPPGFAFDAPMHGSRSGLAFGAEAELRFHYDRVFGVADPNWLTMVRASGFASARLSSRVSLLGAAGYDRATKQLELERASVDVRLGRASHGQVGVLLLPISTSNLALHAPHEEFTDRTLVATELIGTPVAQLGIGLRREVARPGGTRALEFDLVTGYDGGLLTDAPDGTRLPAGRNTFGGKGSSYAAVSRSAWTWKGGSALGVAALGGMYTPVDPVGKPYGGGHPLGLVVVDGARVMKGFRLTGEAAYVHVDVPGDLEALFAQDQWGASVTVGRTLFAPLWKSWENSALSVAVRAESVDFDGGLRGDSKRRVSTTIDLRQRPFAVIRWGWYYEVRVDRLDNPTPAAGLTLSAATFF